MLDHLRGVLIDFGDTLAYLNEEDSKRYEERLLSILRRHGYRKNLGDLTSLLDNAYGNSTKGEVKDTREFWKSLLKILGIPRKPELIEELEENRKRHLVTRFKLYEGAVPVLSSLRRKHKLALVSNCPVGTSDIIEALGLASFFECIILSYQVGIRKPDRRIYLVTLERLKLEPDQCVFVADEISDLEGARDVGLKTLLVRQGPHTTCEARDPDFKPDFQCNRLSEITRFL